MNIIQKIQYKDNLEDEKIENLKNLDDKVLRTHTDEFMHIMTYQTTILVEDEMLIIICTSCLLIDNNDNRKIVVQSVAFLIIKHALINIMTRI